MIDILDHNSTEVKNKKLVHKTLDLISQSGINPVNFSIAITAEYHRRREEKLAKALNEHGVTGAEIAEIAGVTPKTVSIRYNLYKGKKQKPER